MGQFIAVLVFSLVVVLLVSVAIVFADDTESDLGLCLRGYEGHCVDKRAHDLEGSLMIWNSANCSVRDICTPQTCFSSKELADLYIKEFGNETGNVKVPCPPFKPQQQEEEK